MSQFRALVDMDTDIEKQKVLDILRSGTLGDLNSEFGAYMAMIIMKYKALEGRSEDEAREVKLNTFRRYKCVISNTVTFRKDENVVSFKYHTGGFQDLNEMLGE